MSSKVMILMMFWVLVASSDWESDVSAIRSNTVNLNYNVGDIKSYLYEINNGVWASTSSSTPPDGIIHTPMWFSQMLFGTEVERVPNIENVRIRPKYPSGYSYQFGLREQTQDDSQYILDYIADSQTGLLNTEHYNLDSWARGVSQFSSYPTSFLSARSKGDFINKANEETSYSFGYTQGEYVIRNGNNSLSEFRNQVTTVRDRVVQAIHSPNYDGTILSLNFTWLREFIRKVSSGAVDPAAMSEYNWVIRLIPSEGDWLYPIWRVWDSMSLYINAIFYVACYGSIILFVYSRVADILND